MPAVRKDANNAKTIGRPSWKPVLKDYELAYSLWKEGLSDRSIANRLCVSRNAFVVNKSKFERYFKRMELKSRKNNVGRPKGSILDEHPLCKAKILRGFAIAGFSMSEVAKLIGCSKGLLSQWLSTRPSLREIFTNASAVADMQVITALKRRATGMKIPKVKHFADKGRVTDQVEYFEVIPPDPRAATLWLVNRKGWTKDSEMTKSDNRGAILETLDNLTDISKEEIEMFDKQKGIKEEIE